MEMIKIKELKKCPECNNLAESRIIRHYDIKSLYSSHDLFYHCLNPECTITYFNWDDV